MTSSNCFRAFALASVVVGHRDRYRAKLEQLKFAYADSRKRLDLISRIACSLKRAPVERLNIWRKKKKPAGRVHRPHSILRQGSRGLRKTQKSASGPRRTSLVVAPHMSAFGGKADMTLCGNPLSRSLWGQSGRALLHCICPLMTQSGHWPSLNEPDVNGYDALSFFRGRQ
jgi:hypothetical protein